MKRTIEDTLGLLDWEIAEITRLQQELIGAETVEHRGDLLTEIEQHAHDLMQLAQEARAADDRDGRGRGPTPL